MFRSIIPLRVINLWCHLPLKFQEEAQSQVTVKDFSWIMNLLAEWIHQEIFFRRAQVDRKSLRAL